MGSKSRQQTTESPSPVAEAPAVAATATPEQDTVGNAAVAERIKQAPKEPELTMIDAEGDLDLDGFQREMKIRMCDVGYFKDGALQSEQARMLTLANPSQASDLLNAVSTHEAKRLFGKVAVDQRLKLAHACPSLIKALDLEMIVQFMFSGGTEDLVRYVSLPQINALTNAESDGHPKLARLMVDAFVVQYKEALDTMPYYESVLFLLELEKSSWDAVQSATISFNRDRVGAHLDACMRDYPGAEFDALEALFRRLGRGDQVEFWYQEREAK